MFRRFAFPLLVLALLVGWYLVAGWVAERRVNRAIEEISALLPYWITFSSAKGVVSQHYPDSTIYSAPECERESQRGAPRPPPPLGGPCIYGIKRIGQSKSGFVFRLAFDESGALKIRYTHPYYTSL